MQTFQHFHFFGGGLGVDIVRAILRVIHLFYLNGNVSLIISRNASKAF